MTYLLDTCVVSEPTKPKPLVSVLEWLGDQEEIGLYLSVITICEIYKGIARLQESRRKTELRRWVDQDLKTRFTGRILDVDRGVAERWGEVSADAERKGQKISVVDGLIAATALENGLTLVTRNTDDMVVTGVTLFNPWQTF